MHTKCLFLVAKIIQKCQGKEKGKKYDKGKKEKKAESKKKEGKKVLKDLYIFRISEYLKKIITTNNLYIAIISMLQS